LRADEFEGDGNMKGVVRLLAMIALIAMVSAIAVPVLAESWQTRYGTSTLRMGSSGTCVTNLQLDLCEMDCSTNINGSFNENTKDAVMKFQRKMGLSADGVVGNSTKIALWNALN
jgi:peptidoglycan hydrolase-like protein with peptidoglycan-binding domain